MGETIRQLPDGLVAEGLGCMRKAGGGGVRMRSTGESERSDREGVRGGLTIDRY